VSRFQFVADHSQRYGVKRLCHIIGVARSSFYYWRASAPARAAREAADAALAARIRAVRAENDGTYGAPRITAELHDHGVPVNHKRVAWVMRRHRIQGLRLRRRVQNHDPGPGRRESTGSDRSGLHRDGTEPALRRLMPTSGLCRRARGVIRGSLLLSGFSRVCPLLPLGIITALRGTPGVGPEGGICPELSWPASAVPALVP